MSERVSIKKRLVKKGIMWSYYFDFNPAIKNQKGEMITTDTPGINVYVNPSNEEERIYNEINLKKVGNLYDYWLEVSLGMYYPDFQRKRIDDDFLEYFLDFCENRGSKYIGAYKHFKRFAKNKCSFKDLILSFCEKYRSYLLKDNCWRSNKRLSHNTAATYYEKFLDAVRVAFLDGILPFDVATEAKKNPIKWNHNTEKEYLEENEVEALAKVDFEDEPVVKLASLFSIHTGLRRADILKLDWKNIHLKGRRGSHMSLTICKTKCHEVLPLSRSAVKVLKQCKTKEGLVFPGLTEYKLNKYLPKLLTKANITKHITFHCFRHTFAMTLLKKGVDIYSIAKLLGHKSVASTQVYARMSFEQLAKIILNM